MHGSAAPLTTSVSSWLLVLLCAVSGAYCLRRALGSGGAAADAVMGWGMALMAVPLGGRGDGWRTPVLGVVFCGAALHALWLLRGGPHHAHHLVGSLTMVYMALLAGPASEHGPEHSQAAGPPLLTGALLLYYAGYVVLGGTRLITAGDLVPPRPTADRGGPAELVGACRLAMGMGMLAMLLTM